MRDQGRRATGDGQHPRFVIPASARAGSAREQRSWPEGRAPGWHESSRNHEAASRPYFQLFAANSLANNLSVKPRLTLPSAMTTTGRRTSAGYSLISSSHSGSDAGDLRAGGRLRQVMPVRLTSFSQPPTDFTHAFNVG